MQGSPTLLPVARYRADYCFSVRGTLPPAVPKLQAERWLQGRFEQFRKSLAAVDNDETVGVKVEEGRRSFLFEVHGTHIMAAENGDRVAENLRAWIGKRYEELAANLKVDTALADAVSIRAYEPPV